LISWPDGEIADHLSHGPDRHREPDERGHLREAQGPGQHGDEPRPATGRQYEGGPGANPKFTYDANVLLFGSDPVAVDAVAQGIIGKERIARGVQRVDSPGRSPFLELVTSLPHNDPALVLRFCWIDPRSMC
jgi:hypothetical protein